MGMGKYLIGNHNFVKNFVVFWPDTAGLRLRLSVCIIKYGMVLQLDDFSSPRGNRARRGFDSFLLSFDPG